MLDPLVTQALSLLALPVLALLALLPSGEGEFMLLRSFSLSVTRTSFTSITRVLVLALLALLPSDEGKFLLLRSLSLSSRPPALKNCTCVCRYVS